MISEGSYSCGSDGINTASIEEERISYVRHGCSETVDDAGVASVVLSYRLSFRCDHERLDINSLNLSAIQPLMTVNRN